MGGLLVETVPGQAPCSNSHPVCHVYIFNVSDIKLPGITPELLGKRRQVAQHRPEMAGTPNYDEEVPQLVEPEHPGPRVRAPQPVNDRAKAVD